jgi:hypothetical protein
MTIKTIQAMKKYSELENIEIEKIRLMLFASEEDYIHVALQILTTVNYFDALEEELFILSKTHSNSIIRAQIKKLLLQKGKKELKELYKSRYWFDVQLVRDPNEGWYKDEEIRDKLMKMAQEIDQQQMYYFTLLLYKKYGRGYSYFAKELSHLIKEDEKGDLYIETSENTKFLNDILPLLQTEYRLYPEEKVKELIHNARIGKWDSPLDLVNVPDFIVVKFFYLFRSLKDCWGANDFCLRHLKLFSYEDQIRVIEKFKGKVALFSFLKKQGHNCTKEIVEFQSKEERNSFLAEKSEKGCFRFYSSSNQPKVYRALVVKI